ncbi:mevalonate kinase [Leucobacter sp. OLIS6]|uniref:mevalonate kinase n=2 Tax=Leucobacter TaxID=55968 RepID=UPI000C18D49C|nr:MULTISPECIES: mevalonate kinase [unclassified Leucobacter]PII83803.1 mevalonate kinase [Leucobacter sp. OLCALW19]PII89336.1 mevalonate kinase [Leucobacter sp. OLTLW20]PII90667.1 mevalonate kinase [Leucobacter sp. OLAS13]PII99618.1 mevalonate kinase [Leucobacter sp. OLDS2]PIJ05132.1 mevalonate kinase [Leucobacter sp. OLIS6]
MPLTPDAETSDAPAPPSPSRAPLRGVGASHAKAILFGEHAVVYGAPAIAIPVDSLTAEAVIERGAPGLRLESSLFTGPVEDAPARLAPVVTAIRASLERAGLGGLAHGTDAQGATVRIRSSIPHERGLGSSAAVAAAIARAAFDLAGSELDDETLFDLIQTAEKVAHGTPSGIDARTVAATGAIRFNRGAVAPIRIGAPLTLAFADSGHPGSTAKAVGSVQALREREPESTDALLSRLAEIAEGSIAELAAGDRTAIGAAMTEAHGILNRVGVSSERLDAIAEAARAAGAAGAKLTGGGLGGCVIAVADDDAHADRIGAAMRRAGAERTWTVEVPAA